MARREDGVMLESLKEKVFKANLELVKQNLVIYTWGNVSAIDDERKYIVIKPSGVSYDIMKASDMVVVDLDGNVIEGDYKPSSDTPTHLELYKFSDDIKAVVHTHSPWATSRAQAKKAIPCYGTTHADYFYGDILCTRDMLESEVVDDYEKNTGLVIIETFKENKVNPKDVPAVLVASHGPFTWGSSADNAVHNARVLEEVAKMAFYSEQISSSDKPVNKYLLDKHYLRKHGKNAYYGQK